MLANDIQFMRRCIALAEKGEYQVSPNPQVGCVIVVQSEIVGEGWHQVFGQAHAEINALEDAGEKARGATLYVSLEPCCHQGKTGPCCEQIISAGVSRVVFGMVDPNPKVAGKGIAKIKAAGIEVDGPVLEPECTSLNSGFIKRVKQGLPYVRCKLAMSLDGRTAMASGESRWITGVEAREDVQKLRAASDAIITGIGTILKDDPSLNVRMEGIVSNQPLRVIVDSQLRSPVMAKALNLPGDVLLATADEKELDEKYFANSSVQIKAFKGDDGLVNLRMLLEYLAQEKQCNNVLLESGAVLAGSMLQAGLVDEIVTYIAPSLMGNTAKSLFELTGLDKMSDKINLEFVDVAMLGKDCKMRSLVIKS